jgi:hypothetical protein
LIINPQKQQTTAQHPVQAAVAAPAPAATIDSQQV